MLLSRGRRYFAINFNTLFFERVPPQRENQLDYLLSTYVCVLFLLRSALKKELIHILPNTRPFFLPQNAFVSRFFRDRIKSRVIYATQHTEKSKKSLKKLCVLRKSKIFTLRPPPE